MALRPSMALQHLHRGQDRFGCVFDAGVGVQQQVIEMTARPFRLEVPAHEGSAFGIDGVHHLGRLLLNHLQLDQPADFFFTRAIDEHAEGVLALPKNIGPATAYDDTVPFPAFLLDDLVSEFDHLVGVEDLVLADRQGALVAAAPEYLGQTMHYGVAFFRVPRYRLFVHRGEPGDLTSQLLVKELPPLAARQLLGYQTAARPVLPFYGDDPEHRPPPVADALLVIITRISGIGCVPNIHI